jgi:hypothetical protein
MIDARYENAQQAVFLNSLLVPIITPDCMVARIELSRAIGQGDKLPLTRGALRSKAGVVHFEVTTSGVLWVAIRG